MNEKPEEFDEEEFKPNAAREPTAAAARKSKSA